ncbi:MAG: hypothetical protein IH910_07440 [Proteobacteria bacterium]|nr:hypothetical protein [Pseudomonadota bacterium]
MPLARWTLSAAAWFFAATALQAQTVGEPDPLFRSDDILDVRIIAPLSTLRSDRKSDEELPGKFQYTNASGELQELYVGVRTRGRFRLQKKVCSFPPLRLNFKKSQTKNTLFHGQDKVKLVTHCRSSGSYAMIVPKEFLTYRILNTLTDISFRVRLMRITYVDTEKDNAEDIHYGFIIEHRDRLAKRLDMPVLEIPKTQVSALNPEYLNLISMYQYLIGNTDFSPVQGPKGDNCCHNQVLFGVEGKPILSVPYDFDQAGIVDAPHASPNPLFKNLRNVKQRMYRGRCVNTQFLDATIASFKDRQGDILQLINELEVLSNSARKTVSNYVNKFYGILDSEEKTTREFVKGCI